MTANEEKVDLEAQESELSDAEKFKELSDSYSELLVQYYRLRKALEEDFTWILDKLKGARELPRSKTIEIINEVITYGEKVTPILHNSRMNLEDTLGIGGVYEDHHEGVTGPTPDEITSLSKKHR